MIKEESVNQLCYKCHSDKRGPFVWEHPPVVENCLTCHNPHGAKSGRLLNEKMPTLCEDCHASFDHTSVAYGSNMGFKGGANKRPEFIGRSCLNCHGAIHGSNAPGATPGNPGGNLFQR
jgi:DmsE family decaheme c-type cytochrome